MMTAIALDDEPPALKIIESMCSNLDYILLKKTFVKPSDALYYLTHHSVDLIFLDINMPSISGIDFYKSVNQNLMVIFTTAYSEYAVEGFNLQAIDYLLKPFELERFVQATGKALQYHNNILQKAPKIQPYLIIKADYSTYQIKLEDILLIEGLDDYLKIHLQHTKPIVARMTMKTILDKLPERDFVRVHRSFIVPVARIEAVRNRVIYLGKEEIPLGVTYEEKFLKRYQ